MNNLNKRFFVAAVLLFVFTNIWAQKKSGREKLIPIFTADSLRSGSNKDIITSFFQLAFDNLTGNKKEFNFQSNPFAVMLRSNPDLDIDYNYSKYNALRKLNFGFGISLDTSYRFNGFSSGIKYALIDQRDHTTSKLFATNLRINGLFNERAILNEALRNEVKNIYDNSNKTNEDRQKLVSLLAEISKFFNDDKTPFNKLDPSIQSMVHEMVIENKLTNIEKLLAENPSSNLRTNDKAIYEALKDSIKNCALWTISISDTTYTNRFAFSNLVISSEFSKGVFAPKAGANNVELRLRADCNFLRDSLYGRNNLKRIFMNTEAGLNWVIRDKLNQKSWLELMLSSAYYHHFTRLYPNEKRDQFNLIVTTRIRIIDDIWVPFELKYDPTNGNVLGLLNVKLNFTAMKKFLKGND